MFKNGGTVLQVDKNGIQIATTDAEDKSRMATRQKPMAQDLLNGRADWFLVGKQL